MAAKKKVEQEQLQVAEETQAQATEKKGLTAEQIEKIKAKVPEYEEKLKAEIKRLAENGVFQKLEENKLKLEAPVFVMPNGKGYDFRNEKIIPLLAKMAEADLLKGGKTSHLFVSWYSVNKAQKDDPTIIGVKSGSTYMPTIIKQNVSNDPDKKEVIDTAVNLIPMPLVKGNTIDKMNFFLKSFYKDEDGQTKTFRNQIPYDNYAIRIAKLMDYTKITPEAIEMTGVKELLTEVWKEGQEKYNQICKEKQKYFDERLEKIKEGPTKLTKDSTKLDKIYYLYKKNYDKALEEIQKNKEKGIEVIDVPFPTKASYDAAKELLLAGENLKKVQEYINLYDPNAAHNFKGSYFSNIVIRGLENDYKFNQEYKQKYGKTLNDVIKDIKSAKYQENQRVAQGASR